MLGWRVVNRSRSSLCKSTREHSWNCHAGVADAVTFFNQCWLDLMEFYLVNKNDAIEVFMILTMLMKRVNSWNLISFSFEFLEANPFSTLLCRASKLLLSYQILKVDCVIPHEFPRKAFSITLELLGPCSSYPKTKSLRLRGHFILIYERNNI